MNAKFKNSIYRLCAKKMNAELAREIENETNFFALDYWMIDLIANLSETWNIKPRQGWSKARTLWYRILEGSK